MSNVTPPERLAALKEWAAQSAALGHTVPPLDVLEKFANLGSSHIDALRADPDPVVVSWMPTLEFFANEWRTGVHHPAPGSALLVPVGAGGDEPQLHGAPAPATAEGGNADRFEELKSLRAELADADPEGVIALKESHLRSIARSAATTADAIAAQLPASAVSLAGVIAERLASLKPATSAAEMPESAPAPTAAAPLAESAPPAAPAPSQPPSTDVSPDGFTPFDFSVPSGEVIPMRGAMAPDSSMVYSWDAIKTTDAVAIYRLVTSDDYPPFNPDQATRVTTTLQQTAADPRPFASAVRYAQVWVNSGASEADAKSKQPVLYAQQSFVAPPRSVDIREDEGRIIGQWETWQGTTRVLVFRVPIERAAQEAGAPQHRILSDRDNLGGFVDVDGERGRSYLYQVYAEALDNGASKLSPPVSQPVTISDVIEPVIDLVVTSHESDDAPQFDLSWSPPRGGQVVIFRTQQPPDAGAYREAIPESALAQARLNEDDRLRHPIDRGADQHTMSNVPWPRNWSRAYFTPVTVLNGKAHVGTTVSHVYVPPIQHVKLFERVNKQVLTFGWPSGVTSVMIYVGPSGAPIDSVVEAGGALEVTRADYEQRGGFTFPRPLPSSKGCSIILVPVAFQGGERVTGQATSTEYGQLLRVMYETKIIRSLVGGVAGVSVTLTSDTPVQNSPGFVLVHNPDRFPLSREDGRALMMVPEGTEGAAPARRIIAGPLGEAPTPAWRTQVESWKSELPKPQGYVRLFADLPPEVLTSVAVLDPAPSSLRLQSIMGKLAGG